MLKPFLASAAAFGLVMAPVAAQANTRAPDAAISLERASAPVAVGEGLANDDDDDLGAFAWLLGGLILIAVILVVIGDADEDNASPGAN